jgi:Tol biopolymer transport system component/DNA-binding winged helix-turn-helix (wHTH) protein
MAARFSFGAYELDVTGRELRKNGVPLRLQEQPFLVLATLVDSPGRVVTREELRNQLWNDGTFVDFDQSLNKAVNRLRDVLNDDASQPRYIETIPRRGYRFVAHVTEVSGLEKPAAPLEPGAAGANVRPRRTRRLLEGLAAGIVVIAVAGRFYLAHRKSVSPAAPATLILADALAPALSRDGKLLAYVSRVGGDVPHIWVRQTASAQAVQVTKGSSRDSDPDLSPDATQIAYSSQNERSGVYMVPTLGGEPKLVLPDAYWPRFSPDGNSLLCVGADKGLRVVRLDKGRPVEIEQPGRDFDVDGPTTWSQLDRSFQTDGPPLWSASGNEFLFLGRGKNEPVTSNHWWMLSLAGGRSKRLAIPAVERLHHMQPRIYSWLRNSAGETFITYSIQQADTWTLYRLQLTDSGEQIREPEQVVSGSGFLGQVASAADAGQVVYSVGTPNEQIFHLAVDDRGREQGPVAEVPLTEGARYFSPSVSRNGRWMAYTEESIGKHSIMVRDFSAGTSRRIEEQLRTGYPAVSISPDGSKVVFNRYCWCNASVVDCPSFLVNSTGGEPQRICGGCTPRGFSSDGSFVLMQHYSGGRGQDEITAVDLTTSREREFLKSSTTEVYHAFLSWDDRWVVFKKLLGTTQAQIMIAPVRDGRAAGESEWIPVTEGRFSDDKPQFSPDGNSLYFTSDRDGYLCIWRQRLDPRTKHLVGAPGGYEHFHNSMGRDAASYPYYLFMSDLTVARDKVLINLPRGRDDLWMAHVN